MNHRNNKNGKRKCWSLGPHHSTTPSLHHSIPPTAPSLHHSIPPTTPSLRSAFSLIQFIGRLASIVLGCLSRRNGLKTARRFNAGNKSKGASPAGTADSAAAPALGRLAIASRIQPNVETPGYHRSSLRASRPVRRRTNCRNSKRSVEAVNRLNRLNR